MVGSPEMEKNQLSRDSRVKVAFDPLTANFESPGKPVRTYVIASTPRSGSTLLARTLWETGMAGAPHEYLNRIFVEGWFEAWEEMSIPEYLGRLMEINTSPNGVFGLKAHYHQLESTVLNKGLELGDMLPDLTYVRIDRGDTIRQAISFSRAFQTNSWSIHEKEQRSPVYNPAEIYARLKEVVEDELGWDEYFRNRNIDPLRLSYEELENNFPATIRHVLENLGLDEAVASVAEPPMGKQRDDITDDWYRRFIADMEPSGYLGLGKKVRQRIKGWF